MARGSSPIHPRPLEAGDLCGNCATRPKQPGDWLCAECRKQFDQAVSYLRCEQPFVLGKKPHI
jgi:hypothetical protein